MKKTKLYKMVKKFPKQSTVTGKRQITIPKEIYDYLDLTTGDHISFVEKDGEIVIEPTDYKVGCPACKGSGRIVGKICFVCHSKGKIDKEALIDNMGFLAYMVFHAFTYHVSIGYKCVTIASEEGDVYLDYPVLSIESKEYDEWALNRIRDSIQSIFIHKQIESDLKNSVQNKELIEQGIEQSIYSVEEKEKLKIWFEDVCNSVVKESTT